MERRRVAWLGSSLGASAGMVVVAGHLVPQGDKTLAAIPTLAFALVLGASVALWSRRDRIAPAPAFLALAGPPAVATPLAWFAARIPASPETPAAINRPQSSRFVLALAPAPAIRLQLLDRSGTPADKKAGHGLNDPARPVVRLRDRPEAPRARIRIWNRIRSRPATDPHR